MDTIWTYESNEDKELDMTDYSTNTLEIKKGLNRIKIVADENTKGEFDITIPEGEFKELGM